MRHPKEGAPRVASMVSRVPIINAGDGGHNHPTQTLTDLLTIKNELSRISDLTIGFCGDLMFGRTVHSLVCALSRYKNIRFVFISPPELVLPGYIKSDVLDAGGLTYTETSSFEESINGLDILYMTRVQRERFFNEADYVRLKDSYVLDEKKLALAKSDMKILHPLPRVNEIAPEVDSDPRACYFKQVEYGKYIRMALIMKLLEIKM
jgi:aspartate carbamoyltransferase catalytic subunit